MRLAAIMGTPSIFVYTHDSIGVGEDGPTHQPIEQLVALRATPDLYMIRPADANETALAWAFAVSRERDPSSIALRARTSRSSIPTASRATRSSAAPTCCATPTGPRRDPDGQRHRGLDRHGRRRRAGAGMTSASCPCRAWTASSSSTQAYRDAVLPAGRARAGRRRGREPVSWYRWVGDAR